MTIREINTPALNGLVLAGGQSLRMGHDKGAMNWHGREQRYYMADILKNICSKVYISCRPQQLDEIDSHYDILPDTVSGMGPLGGILSAFENDKEAAWLVIACDLPLLDTETLAYLIANRDSRYMATTFRSRHDGLPEPLITIWEPATYAAITKAANEGYHCPRKILMLNSEHVKILEAPAPNALLNANTPEDAEKVKQIIAQQATNMYAG